MKKTYEKILISLGVLWILYFILGQTGMLTLYKSPTTANEPGIKYKSYFVASNFAHFDNGDLICFKHNDQFLGKHRRVYRLVAKENDVVKIMNGVLFINDKNIDKDLSLKHHYMLAPDEVEILIKKKLIDDRRMLHKEGDSIILSLRDDLAIQRGFSNRIVSLPQEKTDKRIKAIYNNNWNIDNFGPLTIPQGKCFVMGDNRPGSDDSRYIGFIDESDVIGTVVYIFD